MNQWLNPLKSGTSSNLVDVGWAAVCVDSIDEETTPKWTIFLRRSGGHDECLRRSRDRTAAAKLGADPAGRDMVNVGTISGLSFPSCSPHEDGQVHRRLMA